MDDSIIIWDSSYHLKKEDFRLKPPDGKIGAFAEVYCGIVLNFTSDDDFLEYQVLAFVNRDSSWIRDTTFSTEYCQLHFDISEKYARLLRKELTSITSKHRPTFEYLIKEKTNQVKLLMKNAQEFLDSETSTGSDPKKRNEWKSKIRNELDSLSDYSSNKWKTVEL